MANGENAAAPVLIIGATGTVGREAVAATLKQGGRVRALVRSSASASALPPEVEPVLGDLRDPGSVARALDGARAALYVSPHEPDEAQLAAGFVRACEAAGVRLVFVGVHIDGANKLTRALKRLMFGRVIPHYRPKLELSERARSSATRPIMLMPTNFFQNDELFREDIEAGSYPTAFERPVNRVDVRDLGLAIARALLDESLPSGAYPVVGPRSLDGDTCASIWSAALSSTVQCERNAARAVAAIERALSMKLSEKKQTDFVKTFAVLRSFELKTLQKDVAATTSLIGKAPTDYQTYVRDTAARWDREAASAASLPVCAQPATV